MSTVVITGAASGIGAACARRLAAGGATVIGIDLGGTEVTADLGTPEGRADAVGRVTDIAGGSLDGLVTCAGLAGGSHRPGSVLASVNYFGTVALMDGLRPLLANGTGSAAGSGSAAGAGPAAVAISSNSTTIQPAVPDGVVAACLAGDEGRARDLADQAGSMATYPATKIAVARWVRRQATGPTWAGSGIRLNAVAPGMVETPLVEAGRADPAMGPLLDQLPMPIGRAGRPEEIAALVDLLLGPDGGFFCGSVVFVDGGTDALLRTDDWPVAWDLDLGTAKEKLTGH